MFSYSISDFLAYDKSIWLAMVGRYLVTWWWVGGIASVLFIVAIARWPARRLSKPPSLALFVLSLCWGWIAWRFHWHEHLSLNWAAGYWALGFAVQAGLLALAAVLGEASTSSSTGPSGRSGATPKPTQCVIWPLLAAALIGPALMGCLVDSTAFFGFEWLGLTPDATALMTLLLISLWRGGRLWIRIGLLLLPTLSLIVSALLNNSLEIHSTGIFVGIGLVAMIVLFAAPGRRSSRKSAAS